MGLVKITGPTSNYREDTEIVSARTSNYGHTRIKSEKRISFRVGDCPVTMKLPKGIDLAEGDAATVVGSKSGGGIKGVLVRNDATGVTYGMSTIYVMAWAIFTLVAGFATIAIIIGLFLTPLGFYLLFKAIQLMRAHRILAK